MKLSGLRDHDDDGIRTKEDYCPLKAEDLDGFNDYDGCPDSDNDNDGIIDSLDTCPNTAEDLDAFEDSDGCPEEDNDQDGIKDVSDSCPNIKEDLDQWKDDDGCPDDDDDVDRDRVLDAYDKCPQVKEDMDNFEDDDGCPDTDNDQDGIPDTHDKCPDHQEVVNGYKDKDGCPDKESDKYKPYRPPYHPVPSINFHSNAALLLPGIEPHLEDIVETLNEWPKVTITLIGHADPFEKRPDIISLQRAKATKKFLVDRGIDPQRISIEGKGRKDPRASNKTAAGRFENRRVEIERTDKNR